jgi:hypothetical protein
MPISTVSVLRVFSTAESLLLGFHLESRWRPIPVEFYINLPVATVKTIAGKRCRDSTKRLIMGIRSKNK